MSDSSSSKGFAAICGADDTVEKVLQNDFPFARQLCAGKLVTSIFDVENLDKVLQFLQEARKTGTAFDWELVVRLESGPLTLHCAAAVLENRLLVIGASSRDSALKVIEEMLRLHNEQSNNLRTVMKDLHTTSAQLRERDKATYDELTRLNNELSGMQRELMKKNHELAKLNQQKNYFLGMASHDLRSPLSTILAYSEYLYDEKRNMLNPDDLKLIATIRRSSEFMLGLINDLLDIAKIDSGKLQLKRQPTVLKNLLSKNVELNSVLADKKSISIQLVFADTLPETVIWDPAKIEQVMNNLLSNAIKFSHPESIIQVSAHPAQDAVTILVEDNGDGIAPDALEQLFTPFNFAGKGGTQGEKSTGLGLSIARRIIEGHGGKIHAEAITDGHGTRFVVTLPAGGA